MAGSIDALIGARCVQALGGALALLGCLELIVGEYGERRGVAVWVTAGVVGTDAGPVAGGLLTQAISPGARAARHPLRRPDRRPARGTSLRRAPDGRGRLPAARLGLVDEALDDADLNGFLEAAIRVLTDSVVDAALKTDDALTRAIDDLDLRALLANLDDPDQVDAQLQARSPRR